MKGTQRKTERVWRSLVCVCEWKWKLYERHCVSLTLPSKRWFEPSPLFYMVTNGPCLTGTSHSITHGKFGYLCYTTALYESNVDLKKPTSQSEGSSVVLLCARSCSANCAYHLMFLCGYCLASMLTADDRAFMHCDAVDATHTNNLSNL